MYLKSWYVLQVRKDNRTDWWDVEARTPVDGKVETLERVRGNMLQQVGIHPDDEYRIIIRTEQQIV